MIWNSKGSCKPHEVILSKHESTLQLWIRSTHILVSPSTFIFFTNIFSIDLPQECSTLKLINLVASKSFIVLYNCNVIIIILLFAPRNQLQILMRRVLIYPPLEMVKTNKMSMNARNSNSYSSFAAKNELCSIVELCTYKPRKLRSRE